jgi:cell shape-determining protein MreC
MAERIKNLEEDIAELKLLTLQAESPRIQNHLAQLLSQFKTELEQLQSAFNSSPEPKKQPAPTPIVNPASDLLKYTSLTKYAWDQEGSKVK